MAKTFKDIINSYSRCIGYLENSRFHSVYHNVIRTRQSTTHFDLTKKLRERAEGLSYSKSCPNFSAGVDQAKVLHWILRWPSLSYVGNNQTGISRKWLKHRHCSTWTEEGYRKTILLKNCYLKGTTFEKRRSWHPVPSLHSKQVETVTDFIFLGSKINADGDCSHKIKRRFLLGRKARQRIKKSRDITL